MPCMHLIHRTKALHWHSANDCVVWHMGRGSAVTAVLGALLGYCVGVWAAHQRAGVHYKGHAYRVCTQYNTLEHCIDAAAYISRFGI